MKNLLSENMMRFGTKNLSESQKRKLTLESIMQTIEEYGLHYEVKSKLMEQMSMGPITPSTSINWDQKPDLNQVQKQFPDLTKRAKSIAEELKAAADGTGTDEDRLNGALRSLQDMCNGFRSSYPEAKFPGKSNYLVAATFAVIDRYISDYSADYRGKNLVDLVNGELSGTRLDSAAKYIRVASGGKISISIPYGGFDNLLKTFGF